MSLSCTCGDGGDFDFYYESPEDFTILDTSKRKRCTSCKALIDKGATVLKFNRWRYPLTDIEEEISGSEIWLAPHWMCEACGDQYMNLSALGFCVDPMENVFDLLKEYIREYRRKVA